MLPEFRATLNQIPGWKVPGVDDLEGCSGCDVRYFCGEVAGHLPTQQLEGWMGRILCVRHTGSSFPAFYGRGTTPERLRQT